ncbi:unnamed protein product [Ambrosiozyma monospora]|uniref:Unnamed protein product n=1 Tax=Ambrosiozyma monospora TaxID=43982 RepID=A0A9W6YTK3_AMBMO|nr:unnamed protein product [Ambrosiozyma monospora]
MHLDFDKYPPIKTHLTVIIIFPTIEPPTHPPQTTKSTRKSKMTKTVILLKNKTVPKDTYETNLLANYHNPIFLPLLTHTPQNQSQILQFLKSSVFLNDFKAFIITSQRCVEALDLLIQVLRSEKFEQLEKVLEKPAYTVGPTTMKILKELGFVDVRGGGDAGNGSILADLIAGDDLFADEKDEANVKNVLFLTGEIRRDIIPKKLGAAGFQLTEMVAYRTEPIDDIVDRYNDVIEKVVHQEIITETKVEEHVGKEEVNGNGSMVKDDRDWLVFFSPQGTEGIVEHLKTNNGVFNIASIGPTTRDYLLGHGLTPDVVAVKPDAVSLVNAILQHDL